MDGLTRATPRQLLLAAVIILGVTVLAAELVMFVDRARMARYDPADIGGEVEEYLAERERDTDQD